MSYRPLAGMVCIKCSMTLASCGFRPLTGIVHRACTPPALHRGFRPLAGNSLDIKKHGQTTDGFRPLTEYKFTMPHIESKEKNHTPEKREWSRKDKP
mgnify:CR=1 FL=1